ncbi:MAG: hypothetical protein JWS12_517 [Candidatus Saccharibacteria bacterium]|nr:hypothetical protein [Candidatus Saccharibacteria bacterium]
MSSSEELFRTVGELVGMRKDIVEPSLIELREGYLANPRQRIEKVTAAHPNTPSVTSVSGNSAIFVNERGRIKQKQVFGTGTAHFLRPIDHRNPWIAIYPYGIENVTSSGSPIFHDPDTNRMRAIALEYPQRNRSLQWLQYPVEPLFNVDEDGTVLARFSDQPTPAELQLFYDILEQFEAAIVT